MLPQLPDAILQGGLAGCAMKTGERAHLRVHRTSLSRPLGGKGSRSPLAKRGAAGPRAWVPVSGHWRWSAFDPLQPSNGPSRQTAFARAAAAESPRSQGSFHRVRANHDWHHLGFSRSVLAQLELVTTRRFCREFNDRFARQLFEKSSMNPVLAISNPGCSRAQPSYLGGVGYLPRIRSASQNHRS
jgi:hypothetical protein